MQQSRAAKSAAAPARGELEFMAFATKIAAGSRRPGLSVGNRKMGGGSNMK
jgi:hypothetical protein